MKDFRNKLNADLLNIIDSDSKDIHQAVLNVAYDLIPRQGWTYNNMCFETYLKLGPFAKWLVLIGKYNQQVCNGGHNQYDFNGYAELHEDLLELTNEFGQYVFTPGTFNRLVDVLTQFWNQQDMYEYYRHTDEDADNDYSNMDDPYFNINETVIDEIEKFLNDLVVK